MELPDPNAPLATRLRNARNYLAAAGFQSAGDVLLDELNDKSPISRQVSKLWFDAGNFTHLMNAAIAHRSVRNLSYDETLCKAILPILQQAIEREVRSLSNTLVKPLRSYSPKDIAAFNFTAIKDELAPTLITLLQGVVGKEEPHESGNQNQGSQSTNTQTRQGRNKPLMVKFALSLLCYARSKSNNLVPGHIGYFLVAASTGKRTIDALHKLGVCIAYESVLIMQKVSETMPAYEFYVNSVLGNRGCCEDRMPRKGESITLDNVIRQHELYGIGQDLASSQNPTPTKRHSSLCVLPTDSIARVSHPRVATQECNQARISDGTGSKRSAPSRPQT
jgi:hypothetical protein